MSKLRTAAAIAAASLAVHEGRFLIAEHGAGGEPGGHAYLPLAGLAVALLLAGASAQLLVMIARARATGRGAEARLGFCSAWVLAALAIAAIFTAQELLEGILAPGRADGLAAVVGNGGWVAYPLALAAGAVAALGLERARAAVASAALRTRRVLPGRAVTRRLALPSAHRPRAGALALHLAGRAPPLALR